jgi:hypothetical protein
MLPYNAQQLRLVVPVVTRRGQHSVQILGTGLWDETNIWSEPLLVGAWYAAPQPELRASFQRRYQLSFGQIPPRLATLAYDAVALATAMAQIHGHPLFSRAVITDSNGYSGLDGAFRFNPQTNVAERYLAVMEVTRNGTVVRDSVLN